jgi:hypothetical protein
MMTEQQTEPEKKVEERTWIEEVEVAGSQLVERVKEIIAEGNAGVVVGGALTLFYPLLAALGAMAALVVKLKIEIVRTEGGEK